jgi:hypothetical protein
MPRLSLQTIRCWLSKHADFLLQKGFFTQKKFARKRSWQTFVLIRP